MTKGEFCEFTEESGCVVEGNIIRNTINGRFTRLDDSFDESKDLHIVHHVCVLGIMYIQFLLSEFFINRFGNKFANFILKFGCLLLV
jgi:hypothetical protein